LVAGHLSQRLSWLWPALIVGAFCLPLFVGLGGREVHGDEAIYSFAVDRMLETGDWLTPRSSPHEDAPFFEKPPLKIWIVAGAIRSGLLPHDEFGLRFWDAVCGALAFLYVFAIGRRLAGPLCGAAAVLILFVHPPLLGVHGLRSNTMDGPLFLSYCAGVYHYLAWTWTEASRRRAWHVAAVCLWFVVGFMTKFVAALFLPLVLGAASLLIGRYRSRLARDWRLWLGWSVVALILIVPWFVYQSRAHGNEFWQILLAEHVVTRFRRYLDPSHVQPWPYYFTQMGDELLRSSAFVMVAVGAALLIFDTIRRRRPEPVVLLLWFGLPLTLMSLGTSKLYHYAYPSLPPIALAGGFGLAFLARLVGPWIDGAIGSAQTWIARRAPRMAAVARRPAVRAALLAAAALGVALAVTSVVWGPIRVRLVGDVMFKSSGLLRPGLAALVLGGLAGRAQVVGRVLVPAALLSLLSVPDYRETFYRLPEYHRAVERLLDEEHAMRAARDCLLRLQATDGAGRAGIYVDAPNVVLRHEDFYYFRRVRPWKRPEREEPSHVLLFTHLFIDAEQRPVLAGASRYWQFEDRLRAGDERLIGEIAAVTGLEAGAVQTRNHKGPPALATFGDVLLLLPGRYAACTVPAPNGGR
jgi:4-amino-4-deoxy-L-arabinose transferase-like glycosyltransferase